MSASTTIHWTADPELLERFVLHRVDEQRRKVLEAHLLTCEDCQLAVNEEQKLILGIKKTGREEMKARLKHKLGSRKTAPVQTRPSWVWAYSAAAVLVILLGLSIYNRWLPFEKKYAAIDRSTPRQQDSSLADNVKSQGEAAVQEKPEEKQKASADQLRDENDKRRPTVTLTEPSSARADSKDRAKEFLGPVRVSPSPEGAGIAQRQFAQPNDQLGKNAIEEYRPGSGIWVDGVVLNEQPDDKPRKALRLDQEATSLRNEAVKKSVSQRTTNATVKEYSLDDLPSAQQMRQQRLQSNTVQTQFGMQGNEIQLQLYRQPQKQLRNTTQRATVQQIGRDSIIVNIDGERIGYKIRGGIDALTNTKKK